MKLQDQVTNLEISKKLKELGVKQESYFYWHGDTKTEDKHFVLFHPDNPDNFPGLLYSAFSVAELGEMLPWRISGSEVGRLVIEKGIGWRAGYITQEGGRLNKSNDSLADAMGKMLIYLFENNLCQI